VSFKSIEDFVQSEFTELVGVGDCYGDEIRIFFAFHPELTFNDEPMPGFIFIADPRFSDDGELRDWGYCLRIKGNSLADIFARMGDGVNAKTSEDERPDPGPITPGRSSGTIDPEEHGIIQE
jgi:hypothetical protein